MKTKIFITAYFLLLAIQFQAQTKKEALKEKNDSIALAQKSKLIVYDFAEGRFDLKKITVKRNEPIAIKIKNINPFFYRIDVKSDDKTISYQNADKEELNNVMADVKQMSYYKIQEQYSFEQGIVSIITDNIPAEKKQNNDLTIINGKLERRDILILEEKSIKEKIDELEKIEKDGNRLTNGQEIIMTDFKAKLLVNQKEQKQNEYETLERINSSQNQEALNKLLNSKIQSLNDKYASFEKNAKEILKLNQNYNNYIDKVISSELTHAMYQNILSNNAKDKSKDGQIESTYLLDKEKLNDAYATFKDYRKDHQAILNELNEFSTFLNFNNADFVKSKDYIKSILFKDIERLQKSIKHIDEVVQKINLSKKLNQVEILDRLLRKESTFEYVSAPIQGEEDYLEFDVKIRSKRNMEDTFHVDNDKSFVYKKFIDGGVRFDVSVGTVFDFFTTDKKYTLSADNIVQRLDNNKYNPTIAAIFHASFRTHNTVAYGISLGTSFTTNFSFNSLFPGFSMLIGKTNKVILTVGPSFRSVDELKTNYLEGQKLTAGIADEDLLTKNFRVGVFFGISYNLTQKQQSSMKLAQ